MMLFNKPHAHPQTHSKPPRAAGAQNNLHSALTNEGGHALRRDRLIVSGGPCDKPNGGHDQAVPAE
jgi:hypothetical protein